MTSLTRKQRRQQELKQRKLTKKFDKLSNQLNDRFEQGFVTDTSENLGLPRLSDPISDFAESLYGSSRNADEIEDIHELVCCCWNIGNCPEKHENLLWLALGVRRALRQLGEKDRLIKVRRTQH